MSKPHYWDEASELLASKDKKLAPVIVQFAGEHMGHKSNALHTLVRAVVGQQISVKAADAIWGRLDALCPGMEASIILSHAPEVLRGAGLSERKVVYVRGIAQAFHDKIIVPEEIARMEAEPAIKELSKLPGIGRWTAEMFLMFHLHHPDVFPLGDLGLIKAIQRLYGPAAKPGTASMERLSKRWQPYRSVATWYLWRSLDPVPVQY
ncbi:DNA-3-methyladenine glycosylase 2 family protein [bacterium]|nr:DNA-3-methyladenine glycosylase 2 family protein [bacterium]